MPSTTFIDGTSIEAPWMNDVNDVVYDILGNGTIVPATKAAARDNLGLEIGVDIPSTTGVGATGAWSLTSLTLATPLPIASGGHGQATAALGFDALKQPATDSYTGVVEKLTSAEAIAGTDDTRYQSAATMKAAQIILNTSVTLTNQTSVDFTSIPSWVKRITVMFSGVSTNGTSLPQIQIGAGSVTTSGYSASSSNLAAGTMATAGASSGFIINSTVAANALSGAFVLTRHSGNIWVIQGQVATGATNVYVSAGSLSLGGTLDRVRLTTVNGTDQFDSGSVNISWE